MTRLPATLVDSRPLDAAAVARRVARGAPSYASGAERGARVFGVAPGAPRGIRWRPFAVAALPLVTAAVPAAAALAPHHLARTAVGGAPGYARRGPSADAGGLTIVPYVPGGSTVPGPSAPRTGGLGGPKLTTIDPLPPAGGGGLVLTPTGAPSGISPMTGSDADPTNDSPAGDDHVRQAQILLAAWTRTHPKVAAVADYGIGPNDLSGVATDARTMRALSGFQRWVCAQAPDGQRANLTARVLVAVQGDWPQKIAQDLGYTASDWWFDLRAANPHKRLGPLGWARLSIGETVNVPNDWPANARCVAPPVVTGATDPGRDPLRADGVLDQPTYDALASAGTQSIATLGGVPAAADQTTGYAANAPAADAASEWTSPGILIGLLGVGLMAYQVLK